MHEIDAFATRKPAGTVRVVFNDTQQIAFLRTWPPVLLDTLDEFHDGLFLCIILFLGCDTGDFGGVSDFEIEGVG